MSVIWAEDGETRMAAAIEERAHRFFRGGIKARCERLTERYLRGLVPVRPNDVVVNFGANIGEVAVALAARGAHVIAIEPDPNVIPALEANAAGRSIEVVPVAAWNSNGTLPIYIDTLTADTSAFLPSRWAGDQRLLPCRRIDGLIKEREIDRVRLIVGDAEGGEPEVLEGAGEVLAVTDYVSVCASAERCGQRTLEACEKHLIDAGFEIIHREESGFGILIGKSVR